MKIWVWLCIGILSTGVHAAELRPDFLKDGSLNISVIGNLQAVINDNAADEVGVKEIELALQSYVAPDIRADIFIAIHEEDETVIEPEEVYFTFFDPLKSGLGIENTPFNRFSAKVGKKFIGIGKQNALHPEQWIAVDKPLVFTELLGEESAVANGAEIITALPLPFFSELSVGLWDPAAHEEYEDEEESDHHEGLDADTPMVVARLWNSMALSDTSELELGVTYLQGDERVDGLRQTVSGLDLTYKAFIAPYKKVFVRAEYLSSVHEYTREGGYVLASYTGSKWWETGVRYDIVKANEENTEASLWSFFAVKKLSEVSRLKVQYAGAKDVAPVLSMQLIFGIGPHSHVLQ